MSITVIAGLGNPGSKYQNTRHNVGFGVVEALAKHLEAKWKSCDKFESEIAEITYSERKLLLLKPQTFMNHSGRALGALMHYRRLDPENLLVIFDDITLEFSRCKLSLSGSAGGHNGVADILDHVGSGFGRFRIGVGAKIHKAMDLADYVLSQFSGDENKLLNEEMPTFVAHLLRIIDSDFDTAMNTINQRNASEHERN
ncbi:MAG: Peptidyl-tRNA hydrolase [Opitutia bacterium UBA7350]|nr:MAG: Peptidyl-tRNA hydrolase [Opitutae bacterium UBA7350]